MKSINKRKSVISLVLEAIKIHSPIASYGILVESRDAVTENVLQIKSYDDKFQGFDHSLDF